MSKTDENLYELEEVVNANEEYNIHSRNDEVYTRKLPATVNVVTLILQTTVLALLVALIAVSIFNTIQCKTTNDSNSCYNSTQITEILKMIAQDLHQQIIYSQNNTAHQYHQQQMVYIQNNTDIIDQLLKDIFTEQMAFSQNNMAMLNLLVQNSENSLQKLINVISTLSNIKNTSTSISAVTNDILLVAEELLQLQNASVLFDSITPVSCKDIKTTLPSSPTGYYHVNSRNIYCNMGELCGSGGVWTRLAYLNMSDSTEYCPAGFKLYESNGVRACGRANSSTIGSCQSVKFPSNGICYSQVCGRVVGYQYYSTDAVYSANNDINSHYVDGVSITRGSPRQHIWTLMSGLLEASYYIDGRYNCPCSQGSLQNSTVQSFIGNDYFCESGNPRPDGTFSQGLYTQDPLWDGKGCGSFEGNCCSAPGLPWFNKVFNSTTTDYIELRVCCDQIRTSVVAETSIAYSLAFYICEQFFIKKSNFLICRYTCM